MSWFYRHLARPILFTLSSEQAHHQALATLAFLSKSETLSDCLQAFLAPPPLPTQLWNLHFPNPVGLAAGMDKAAQAVPAWEALGFGFCELGGVTWHSQAGNPIPRLFRVPAEQALVNRMGFNNPGATALAATLQQWHTTRRWPHHPVGINLGKSKITPLDQAALDYLQSFQQLRSWADFFVVNVSSPNTPGLRQLQDKAALDQILAAHDRANCDPSSPTPAKPILVKVAPDLSWNALDDILELTGPRRIAGLVATNTTLERPDSINPDTRRILQEPGGLSGRPLRKRSTDVIRYLYRQTRGRLPIIGVGGIFNAADAWEKILAGASLLQIYTGLIYEGPTLPHRIVHGLIECLHHHGCRHLADAIGQA